MIRGSKKLEQQMEDECHTQRKNNIKKQDEKATKKEQKQVPTPNNQASEQFQEPTQQTSILNKFHHNSFTNFSMKKNKEGNQAEHQDMSKKYTQGNTKQNTTIIGSFYQNPT